MQTSWCHIFSENSRYEYMRTFCKVLNAAIFISGLPNVHPRIRFAIALPVICCRPTSIFVPFKNYWVTAICERPLSTRIPCPVGRLKKRKTPGFVKQHHRRRQYACLLSFLNDCSVAGYGR